MDIMFFNAKKEPDFFQPDIGSDLLLPGHLLAKTPVIERRVRWF
jgi:hypothetical protein